MDELLDVLDSHGKPTGISKMKSEVHRLGLLHHTVHVWFYTQEGHVLLQQRGKCKKTFPLFWDVSVAGHIGANEGVETAAVREIKEEIGLPVSPKELQKIGVFDSLHKHSDAVIDNEIHHVFLTLLETGLEALSKQDEEVAALRLLSLDTFRKWIEAVPTGIDLVPHGTAYYQTVLAKIFEILNTD